MTDNSLPEDALERQDFKDNIDELQFLVKEYRTTEHFQKMLDFIVKCNWLAPYNAMLVEMQFPGAFMVLNGKDWAKFNRRPKPNARKLVTLMNFGPVQFMFDYSDTEPIPGKPVLPIDDIMRSVDQSLNDVEGEVPDANYDLLMANMSQLGIFVDDRFEAANSYGGYIMPYDQALLKISMNKDLTITYPSAFLISVNRNESKTSKFQKLCHELGHLFCQHQWYEAGSRRHGTKQQREFEAETVAWIVCKRMNIRCRSEEYLALYAKDGELPLCSTDLILKAVKKIEDLMRKPLKIKTSPWYEHDKRLKERVNKTLSSEVRHASPSLFDEF